MNKKFIIHFCPGTGGMFLSSVFAKIMNIPIKTKISSLGDCHDLGSGIWRSHQTVVINDIFDTKTNKMRLNHRPGGRLYLCHAITNEFIEQHPDIEVVQISASPDDYFNIAMMVIKKAWPNKWTKEEYTKWVGPDYPPHSPNNIAESDLICKDLMDNIAMKETSDWFKEYQDIKYSHCIDFNTIMGINNNNLIQKVASITGENITDNVCKFVSEYQQLNKKLYFS